MRCSLSFRSRCAGALLAAAQILAPLPAVAAESAPAVPPAKSSLFTPRRDPDRPRSDLGIPFVSFLLPGFDQWWEGQYGSAGAYTGIWLGSSIYAATVAGANGLNTRGEPVDEEGNKIEKDEDGDGKPDEVQLDQKDVAVRKVILGGLLAQGAGGMSAYQSFRTAARSRQSQGQYGFLTYDETPVDLLKAPFDFSYLKRSSTYVPLAIGAALAGLILSSDPGEDMERTRFNGADAFFTSAYSYNAGTHEEAMFRGWMMPVMYEYWGSPFWSNAAQAVLFAAAHLGTNDMPLPQLFLGYHLGDVTQDDGWRLGEAVFIHVWWDVLAFTTAYHYKRKPLEPEADSILGDVAKARRLTLWLPPLYVHF